DHHFGRDASAGGGGGRAAGPVPPDLPAGEDPLRHPAADRRGARSGERRAGAPRAEAARGRPGRMGGARPPAPPPAGGSDPAPGPALLEAEAIPLEVVYEDDDLLVINKPKGLVVHPAPGNWSGTLVNALLARVGTRLAKTGSVERPGIVHRLDKDTSGLLVVA